jgi:hypothetical protein
VIHRDPFTLEQDVQPPIAKPGSFRRVRLQAPSTLVDVSRR